MPTTSASRSSEYKNRIGGSVRKNVGGATNNRSMQARGLLQKAKGKVQQGTRKVAKKASNAKRSTRSRAAVRPKRIGALSGKPAGRTGTRVGRTSGRSKVSRATTGRSTIGRKAGVGRSGNFRY